MLRFLFFSCCVSEEDEGNEETLKLGCKQAMEELRSEVAGPPNNLL
jgi:hypothetical protein